MLMLALCLGMLALHLLGLNLLALCAGELLALCVRGLLALFAGEAVVLRVSCCPSGLP